MYRRTDGHDIPIIHLFQRTPNNNSIRSICHTNSWRDASFVMKCYRANKFATYYCVSIYVLQSSGSVLLWQLIDLSVNTVRFHTPVHCEMASVLRVHHLDRVDEQYSVGCAAHLWRASLNTAP